MTMKANSKIRKQLCTSVLEDFDVYFNADKDIWLETPVTFRDFVVLREHMNFPPLSERQIAPAEFLFGDDPKKIFDTGNTIAVLAHGKGAGKDTIAALLLSYATHVLLCMRSPQKFFGLPEGEPIDLLNVAISADQASNVFFEKFKQRLLHWQWLRDKYPVKLSGSFLGQTKLDDILHTVVITKNAALFPKNIRAVSGHSETNAQEGKNILFFVCDEISGFDETPTTHRGKTIFNMLKSSAVSRFGNRFKGIAISFPRYANDAILQLYKQAESELHWFSDKACTWEVKPTHLFKDYPQKYFLFEDQKVPLEFQSDFKSDPDDARTKYMCIPPEISSAFIDKVEKISMCVTTERQAFITVNDYVEDNKIKKNITSYNKTISDSIPYIVTIDLGLKSDSAALSIFHKEPSPQGILAIQDYVGAWVPDPGKQIEVSINNIKEFIEELHKHIHIQGVYFDQWNSALLIEQLNELHIYSETYNLNFADYKHAKEMIYAKRISLLDYTPQLVEFKRLILTRGNRVDHPADGCFTGDTQIKLLNGTIKTMKELAELGSEKTFWVYACDKYGKIVPAKAYNAHKTKTANKLYKITLDNGRSFRCTPEHLIMLRNGTYKQAQELTINDSVMPLRWHKYGNYEIIWDNKTNKQIATHKQVYTHMYKNFNGKTHVIHHYDINPSNNTPDNLELLTREEHAQRHAYLAELGKKHIAQRVATYKANNKKFPERIVQCAQKLKAYYQTEAGKQVHRQAMLKSIYTKNTIAGKLRAKLGQEKAKITVNGFDKQKKQMIINKFKQTYQINKKKGLHKKCSTNTVYWKSAEGIARRKILSNTQLRNASARAYQKAYELRHRELQERIQGKIIDTQHCLSYKHLTQQLFGSYRSSLCRALAETYNISFVTNLLRDFQEKNLKENDICRLYSCTKQILRYYLKKYNIMYVLHGNTYNHKVVAIQIEDNVTEDVYDITVPEYNNFALAAGIFVHNSKDVADTVVGACKLLLAPKNNKDNILNMQGGYYIEENLYTMGGTFLKD